jgi:Mce-associated membrane protein
MATDPPSGGRPGPASGSRNAPPFRGPLALFSASVLLVAVGVALLGLAPGGGSGPATRNQALTNAALTRRVTTAVSADVAAIYSYDYTDLSATTNQARQVLTGLAATQYGELERALPGAVKGKLVVSTKVTSIGVESLTPDSASLLVFLKQASTRAGKPAGTVDGQLRVTARDDGGRWLITTIAAR